MLRTESVLSRAPLYYWSGFLFNKNGWEWVGVYFYFVKMGGSGVVFYNKNGWEWDFYFIKMGGSWWDWFFNQ